MPVTRKVYEYGCLGAISEEMRTPEIDAKVVSLMKEALRRHCADIHSQMLGEPEVQWVRMPTDKEHPWRVYATCAAIKLGRRKSPYPISENRADWREIDLRFSSAGHEIT